MNQITRALPILISPRQTPRQHHPVKIGTAQALIRLSGATVCREPATVPLDGGVALRR